MAASHDQTWQDSHGDDDQGTTSVPIVADRPIDLYVENPNGDTVIGVAARNDILVSWHKHGRPDSTWYKEATVHVSQEGDNRIGVKVSLPPIWPGGDFGRSVLKFLEGGLKGANPFASLTGGGVGFDLTIELPRRESSWAADRVRVRTANGNVAIEDVSGSIDVATANGEVTARRTHGEVAIHAANGDLHVERPVGRVTARAVSGNLRIESGDLTRFTLTTVNGDIAIGTALTGDASRIESVNGDIHLDLTLPETTGGSISVRSISGDANVAPPFRAVAKRTWRIGPASDDGPSVAIKTVSGDVHARGRLSGDVTPPDTPVAPPTPQRPAVPVIPVPPSSPNVEQRAKAPSLDSRLEILQAVERGELDIDEALRRLDSLGQSG
jgi:hypothetical protein